MDFNSAAPSARRLFPAVVLAALSLTISAAAAGADLPVYPAAKPEAMPAGSHPGVTSCGHTITVEKSFTVDADPHTVAKWYESKMPGSRMVDANKMADADTTDSTMTSLEVFNADGSQTVLVSRFNYGSKNAKAMIGLDKTDIGIESVSPPLGSGFVALAAQASSGGAAAKVASEQIKASCKG